MANSELVNLSATTTLASTDILYAVVDPAGTPLDRKITAKNAGLEFVSFGLLTASATLSTATPNSLSFQQWGTEEAVVAQADAPGAAVVLAWLAGTLRPGPGSPAAGDRGQYKLQASFDGGSNFSDMSAAYNAFLASATAGRNVSVAAIGRSTGTVTGDIQVRAQVVDVDQANDTQWASGVITILVLAQ